MSMTPADRDQAESLFEAALAIEPEQRREFVMQACGTNDAMRAAVLALLAAHTRASGVLDVPATSLLERRDAPLRLGVYRVLREIGRGGMGVVYDAERDDGQFRRRVAIKVIRGSSDPDLVQRLFAERQILAALDHPAIARLLDGGVTPDDVPYLVMEHVDGLPVDVYCERMALSVAERLRLFVAIARAVDFAHRNLIIHRDLKPSNILVTPDGRVKLLDFGVATLLNPSLLPTSGAQTRQRALTPEYASPEQLRGESLTTTTDVYSLGVVLYELLTGRRPYAQHEAALSALQRAVADTEFERPSARVLLREVLSAPGGERVLEPVATAAARQTTPRRLARQLRGDIDAIIEQALRREPVRRYGSAELLAQDIERHLDHRPVRAHSGGRWYVMGRALRRHRLETAAAMVAAVSILFGVGAAMRQTALARGERLRAETALAHSEQVTGFVLDLFRSGDPVAAGLEVLTARDLVRRGTARIDELAGQPLLQARMLGVLGHIHESLGEFEDAQRLTARALTLHMGAATAPDARTGELLLQLGILQRRRGEYDSAQATFLRARELQEQVLGPGDATVAQTLQQLASIAIYRGDHIEAERRARDALELQRRTLGDTHRLTVNSLVYVATILRTRGALEESERLLRRALELRPQTTGSTRAETLNDRMQLATVVRLNERPGEAETMVRSTLASTDPARPEDIPFIIWAKESLATLAGARDDHAEAERLYREVLDLRMRINGRRHTGYAGVLALVAAPVMRQGRLDEAEQLLGEAIDIYREKLGPRHLAVASTLLVQAELHQLRHEYAYADSLIELSLSIRAERSSPRAIAYADALRQRGQLRLRMGDHAAARALLEEALDIVQGQAVPGSPEERAIHRALADLHAAMNQPADAARHRSLAAPR